MIVIPESRTPRAQARFRIDAPNAQPREITVVALDPVGEAAIHRLMVDDWTRTRFLPASPVTGVEAGHKGAARFSMRVWLDDLSARMRRLLDAVGNADIVVMVTSTGNIADAAHLIGEACAARHAMTTAMVIAGTDTGEAALAETMSALRPYASMIAVGDDDDFIRAMLAALGA